MPICVEDHTLLTFKLGIRMVSQIQLMNVLLLKCMGSGSIRHWPTYAFINMSGGAQEVVIAATMARFSHIICVAHVSQYAESREWPSSHDDTLHIMSYTTYVATAAEAQRMRQ